MAGGGRRGTVVTQQNPSHRIDQGRNKPSRRVREQFGRLPVVPRPVIVLPSPAAAAAQSTRHARPAHN